MPVSGSSYSYCYAALGEVFAWGLGWILMLEYTLASSTLAVGFSSYLMSLLRRFRRCGARHTSPRHSSGRRRVLDEPSRRARDRGRDGRALRRRAPVRRRKRLPRRREGRGAGGRHHGRRRRDRPGNWKPFMPPHEGEFAFGWPGIVRAASILFFAYLGFETVSTAASESRNPQRDMPIGILGALVVCTVLYLAVAAVLTGVVPYRELGVADPVAVAVDRMGHPGVAIFVKLGALMGLASVLLVNAYRPVAHHVPDVARRHAAGDLQPRARAVPHAASRDHRARRHFRGLRRVLPDRDARGPREPRGRSRVRDRLLLHDVAALAAAGPAASVSRAARRLPGRPRLDRLHSGGGTRALYRA